MNSPTSNVLHSIQLLKAKLRNDHQQLQCIRKDFDLPAITIPEQLHHNEFKVPKNCGRECRQKLIDLRKKQQSQIQCLIGKHNEEKENLIREYQQRLKEVQKEAEDKLNEQDQYINALEEQIAQTTRSITTKVEKQKEGWGEENRQIDGNGQKYEHIVNNLLKQNAVLMETVERLKMENRKLAISGQIKKDETKEANDDQAQQTKPNKRHNSIFGNRLKFSKVGQSKSNYSSVIQDENSDISNWMSGRTDDSPWGEDTIMSEDLKIKTIKHLLYPHEEKAKYCR